MDGNAVEVAIALWHAPARRAALRRRPLPDDVGLVIELAGGAPKRLADWSARTGEPVERLKEAAQFYLREILLFDGADAYRILGVSPDADVMQIKAHHRGLLHWLHPDRRGNDGESNFAVGINAAWSQLRSSDRRAAYDERRVQAHSSQVRARVWVPAWHVDPTGRAGWAGWLAIGLAATVGIWLAVLLDRKANVSAPAWDESMQDAAGGRAAIAAPLNALAATGPTATAAAHDDGTPDAKAVEQPGPGPGRINASVAIMPIPQDGQAIDAQGDGQPDDPGPAAAMAAGAMHDADVAAWESSAPVIDAPEPQPLPPIDSKRALAATRVGREVMRYLTSESGHVPPVWRDVAAQDAATSIRERFGTPSPATRLGVHAQFGAPTWSIGAERGTMRARISSYGNEAGATVRVDMTWRDNRWLVDAIGMETAQ